MNVVPGKFNDLEMVKSTDFGIYLDGGDGLEILMPLKYVPADVQVGDSVHCFVYYDSEDRLVATTESPLATVGTCARLDCVATTKFGAFLDWGLAKDLLVPFREQNLPMEDGKAYSVYVYLDKVSNRIVGSAKLDKHLNKTPIDFAEGDEVSLFIARKTDKGYVAVINNSHTGLIYANEIFQAIQPGDVMKGYIQKIREDGKTDLSLQRSGFKALMEGEKEFISALKSKGGFVEITDKSTPEEIYSTFGMSKKNWKKLVGHLYKKRKLQLFENGIRLVEEGD